MQKTVKNVKKFKYNMGSLYVQCYTKNTLFTLTNKTGKTLYQISSRSSNIKDFKRNTPFVVQTLSNQLAKHISSLNIKYLKCYIKGIGLGRYNFLKSLKKNGIKIIYIKDKTPIPFNGCKPKKQKRR